MPRSILELNGGRFVNDDIDLNTHVVIGRLNKEPLTPKAYAMSPQERAALPREERDLALEALRVFAHEEVSGKFALKAMRWTTSEAAAQFALDTFTEQKEGDAPKWIELSVAPVTRTLDHA